MSGFAVPQCHVLKFSCDDYSGCELTILVNGVRFYILVEERELRDEELKDDYHDLLQNFTSRKAGANETEEFGCTTIDTKNFKTEDDGRDSAHGSSPAAADTNDLAEGQEETDSAVDVEDRIDHNNVVEKSLNTTEVEHEAEGDAETLLQNWILQPFGEEFQKLAPASSRPANPSLHDWYHPATYFFAIESRDGQLCPVEVKDRPELQTRLDYLTPRMSTPKHFRDMEVPWLNSKDITVLSESDDPGPLRPARVQVGNDVRFLKLVDPELDGPAKRELKILARIERLGLHKKFHVPQIMGMVRFEDSKKEIMGFLLTEIIAGRPLTHLIDSDSSEDKRKKWADESSRIVRLLHEHKIVWGDAKADNFLVDGNDDLWIIDFGGSWTEGWVDPELMETEEGDKMGLGKIVGALEDPDRNSYEPDAADEAAAGLRKRRKEDYAVAESSRKTKRPWSEDAEEEESPRRRLR